MLYRRRLIHNPEATTPTPLAPSKNFAAKNMKFQNANDNGMVSKVARPNKIKSNRRKKPKTCRRKSIILCSKLVDAMRKE